jgi:branched-chain amino acid aminotransferase
MDTLANREGFIWMDGQLIDWADAKVHVLTHTLHYGLGVFEGVRAYSTPEGTKIFRLNDHTNRLFESAKAVNMKIPFSQQEINEAQKEVFRVNELDEGYIRPMCFYGSEGMGLRADNLKVHCIVAAWEWPSYMSPEAFEKGINIKISSYKRETGNIVSRSKVNGNYVTSIMALQEAMKEGYDEALLLDDEDNISEGSGENFFIVKNKTLYTPDLDASLDGITRKSIISLAEELAIKVEVKKVKLQDVLDADELFFTGTAAEVVPIRSVDKKLISDGVRGEITTILQKNYFDQVRGKRDSFSEWLSAID